MSNPSNPHSSPAVNVQMYDVVLVKDAKIIGIVSYLGPAEWDTSARQYVGLTLSDPIETGHNGTERGKQYFECEDKHGVMVPAEQIFRVIPPPELLQKVTILNNELLRERNFTQQLKHKFLQLRQAMNRMEGENLNLRQRLQLYEREGVNNQRPRVESRGSSVEPPTFLSTYISDRGTSPPPIPLQPPHRPKTPKNRRRTFNLPPLPKQTQTAPASPLLSTHHAEEASKSFGIPTPLSMTPMPNTPITPNYPETNMQKSSEAIRKSYKQQRPFRKRSNSNVSYKSFMSRSTPKRGKSQKSQKYFDRDFQRDRDRVRSDMSKSTMTSQQTANTYTDNMDGSPMPLSIGDGSAAKLGSGRMNGFQLQPMFTNSDLSSFHHHVSFNEEESHDCGDQSTVTGDLLSPRRVTPREHVNGDRYISKFVPRDQEEVDDDAVPSMDHLNFDSNKHHQEEAELDIDQITVNSRDQSFLAQGIPNLDVSAGPLVIKEEDEDHVQEDPPYNIYDSNAKQHTHSQNNSHRSKHKKKKSPHAVDVGDDNEQHGADEDDAGFNFLSPHIVDEDDESEDSRNLSSAQGDEDDDDSTTDHEMDARSNSLEFRTEQMAEDNGLEIESPVPVRAGHRAAMRTFEPATNGKHANHHSLPPMNDEAVGKSIYEQLSKYDEASRVPPRSYKLQNGFKSPVHAQTPWHTPHAHTPMSTEMDTTPIPNDYQVAPYQPPQMHQQLKLKRHQNSAPTRQGVVIHDQRNEMRPDVDSDPFANIGLHGEELTHGLFSDSYSARYSNTPSYTAAHKTNPSQHTSTTISTYTISPPQRRSGAQPMPHRKSMPYMPDHVNIDHMANSNTAPPDESRQLRASTQKRKSLVPVSNPIRVSDTFEPRKKYSSQPAAHWNDDANDDDDAAMKIINRMSTTKQRSNNNMTTTSNRVGANRSFQHLHSTDADMHSPSLSSLRPPDQPSSANTAGFGGSNSHGNFRKVSKRRNTMGEPPQIDVNALKRRTNNNQNKPNSKKRKVKNKITRSRTFAPSSNGQASYNVIQHSDDSRKMTASILAGKHEDSLDLDYDSDRDEEEKSHRPVIPSRSPSPTTPQTVPVKPVRAPPDPHHITLDDFKLDQQRDFIEQHKNAMISHNNRATLQHYSSQYQLVERPRGTPTMHNTYSEHVEQLQTYNKLQQQKQKAMGKKGKNSPNKRKRLKQVQAAKMDMKKSQSGPESPTKRTAPVRIPASNTSEKAVSVAASVSFHSDLHSGLADKRRLLENK